MLRVTIDKKRALDKSIGACRGAYTDNHAASTYVVYATAKILLAKLYYIQEYFMLNGKIDAGK